MQSFLSELDEYFCQVYAGYDKLCVLDGYEQPVMQSTRTDEFGRTIAYTLPMSEMSLSRQEKKTELLAALKEKICDVEFSFPILPLGFFAKIGQKFSKKSFYRVFKKWFESQNVTEKEVLAAVDLSEDAYKEIKKGRALPCKSLLFTWSLALGMTCDDALRLLSICGAAFDFSKERDVVVAYLLQNRVYNRELVQTALKEYRVGNLYFRKEND